MYILKLTTVEFDLSAVDMVLFNDLKKGQGRAEKGNEGLQEVRKG